MIGGLNIIIQRISLGVLLLTLATMATAPVMAQQSEVDKLVAPDGQLEDFFGGSVAIDGDVAVVGAYRVDDLGQDAGAVYVFRYDIGSATWNQEQKLLASDGELYDFFGSAVAIEGNTIIVGAFGDGPVYNGAVYVFRYDTTLGTWVETNKIVALDGFDYHYFGYSVDIYADVALIGAFGDDDLGQYSGSAYIFRYDPISATWSEEDKLLASDGLTMDFFGYGCTLAGNDLALVGASQHSHPGYTSCGAVYAFKYDPSTQQWSEIQEILKQNPSPADGDQFGASLSASGNILIVGSVGDDSSNTDAGAAYVYEYNPISSFWSYAGWIHSADIDVGDEFGFSVSVTGNEKRYIALIGARYDEDNGQESGSAYLFRSDVGSGVWIQTSKLVPSDGEAEDQFGYNTAISGNMGIVAAPYEDTVAVDAGAAYGFHALNLNIAPDPLPAGQAGYFYVTSAAPNSATFLAYGVSGLRNTYVPQLKVWLDIKTPKKGTGPTTSDSYGGLTWVLPIPALHGVNVWLQAVQDREASNVVASSIQ